mgnify:CR=1 FL=1
MTTLQADDRNPPIILVQSDEGPFPERDGTVPWHEQPPHVQRIKTSIINAYYFPNGDYSQMREGVTPVNSYRILFNTYFGTNFALLPDRIFVSPDERRLYEFHDVTDAVLAERDGASTPAIEGDMIMTDPVALPD